MNYFSMKWNTSQNGSRHGLSQIQATEAGSWLFSNNVPLKELIQIGN